MKFLEAVKELYPQYYIRTRSIDNHILYNIDDINELLDIEAVGHLKLYDANNNTYTYYINETNLLDLLKTSLRGKIIEQKMNKIITKDILKRQIQNIFDELFIEDVKIENYTIDMYFLKYKVGIELPGNHVDPQLRARICEKADIHCFQLHDESTFNGDVIAAYNHFSNVVGTLHQMMK